MKFKQAIHISSQIEGVFRLPCVAAIRKDIFGAAFFDLYGHMMHDKKNAVAREGDWLCELRNGKWIVMNNKEYEENRD